MREKAVRFGKTASMVGIVSDPPPGMDPASMPGVIFLNSGIVHHVGACRLHTRIARGVAPRGCAALRFDLSGIGDSEARRDSLSFEESAVIETREAMDYLASTRKITEFVLVGLCSGADVAHLTARVDERVKGIVMFDAWTYRDSSFFLRHYGRRMLRPSVWKNAVAIRGRRLLESMKPQKVQAGGSDDVIYEMPRYVRVFPPKETVGADLKNFVQRGVNMFIVFTGGQEELYNDRSQYARVFSDVDFGGLLRVEYIPDATHIFTGLDHQEFLVREVPSWIAGVGH